MKKIIFLLSLLLVSCYDQERDCAKFKTGKFTSSQRIDSVLQTSTFERNDSLQIETFNGKTDTATVRWVNECECILQKLHPKNRLERKRIAIRILTTEKNKYDFDYSFVGETNKLKGTVTKIE